MNTCNFIINLISHTYVCMQGICGLDESVPVAVKTLSRERMKDIDKFMEEVDLMKQFTHPNIVSLLGTCIHAFQILNYKIIISE